MEKREIKFRGKRKDNDMWIYGSYHLHKDVMLGIATKEQVQANEKTLIIQDGMSDWNLSIPINTYEVIPESIGEFTGLHDKNGKDIYEGDICKSGYGDVGEIKMDIGAEGEPADALGSYYGWCFDYRHETTGFLDGDLTVIGNIYDNPELIK